MGGTLRPSEARPRTNPPDAAEQLEILVPFVAGTALRDQRETMQRSFFSIAKGKRLKPIEYVSPDPKRNPGDYDAAFLGLVKKRAAEVG